ncbi:MAG: hypothetical protein A3J29_00680 [Acidobacteria bacterium RIFCSPLOWO2_12_FULL_67_14b]|nr:MAG: hypothetical protein A3J29_00680 [Acidobacteria bacterium RIFCSPLOWO2_12_FULL_67_14b]
MRTIPGFIILTAALAVAGCATMTVSSHIERGINFTDYRTYDWGAPDKLPVGDPRLDNNPFFRDYLQGTVEKKMAAKGYERVNGEKPDVLIHYHASVHQKLDVFEADREYGYTYGGDRVVEYEQGTLVIDLVDARTNKLIWRGWAQDTMTGVIDNQPRLEKQVDEGVTKMMLLLPRGGAARR